MHTLLSSYLAGLSSMVLELTQPPLYYPLVSNYTNYVFQTSDTCVVCPIHLLLMQSFSHVFFFFGKTCRNFASVI